MSSASDRKFATPGSRSFVTPIPGSSRNISREFSSRATSDNLPKRLDSSLSTDSTDIHDVASSANQTIVDDEDGLASTVSTPMTKDMPYKRPMPYSSGYALKRKSVILTTPDDHNNHNLLYAKKMSFSCGAETSRESLSNFNREIPSGRSSGFETSLEGKTAVASSHEMISLSKQVSSANSSSASILSSAFSQIPQRKKAVHQPQDLDESTTASTTVSDGSTSVITSDQERTDSPMVVDRRVGNRAIFSDNDDCNDTKTYMSVVKSMGKIGLAYYDTENCQVNMMEDLVETEDYHFLKIMKRRIQPDFIITSAKQEEQFLQALKEEDEDENSRIEKQIKIEIIPCMMFGYDICKRRILTLDGLPGLSQDATDMQRNIYYGSMLSFDNINMVRATGALLKYLDKNRVGVELEDPDVRVPIVALKSFSLSSVMMIDDSTYGALQIFSKESHPSAYKSGGSGSKEGLSLFGMMNYTKSGPGSKLFNQWFLHPLTNIDEIRERQDTISFFLQPRRMEAFVEFQDHLKYVKNVSGILSKMLSTGANINDWRNLYKAIYNAICIGDVCRGLPQNIAIIRKITNAFSDKLHSVANLINKIVDFEESASAKRFTVRPGVDAELDKMKKTFNGLPDLMTDIASKELRKLDESITECGVSYLPQLGYLLNIPMTQEMREGKFDIDGLRFVFISEGIAYYRTAGTRELDQLLGDTQSMIIDKETAIMYRLQNVILEHSQLLLSIVEFTAELDCLLALATASREGNYVRPELTEQPILTIKGGRHPIQELCTSQFVPNDVEVEMNKGRMKIITGPNSSGKSVYLKQVGLTTFLAQIGCFVPADSATIGICDRLFTRIHAKETVSTQQSTFMIDLNQISSAVHNANDKSLVLIDEFGKGTTATDGLALLTATLLHLLSQAPKCPRVFLSTHFHGLIRYNLLPESEILHYQTMEVLEEEGDLVFLYHLKDGHADCSHALRVAAVAGIEESIIKRAEEVSELILQNKEINRVTSMDSETKQKRFETIVDEFLALDLENRDVAKFLENCIRIMDEP